MATMNDVNRVGLLVPDYEQHCGLRDLLRAKYPHIRVTHEGFGAVTAFTPSAGSGAFPGWYVSIRTSELYGKSARQILNLLERRVHTIPC